MLAYLKRFINSGIGTANMKPINEMIEAAKTEILTAINISSGRVVVTSNMTWTAPKAGTYKITAIGAGGKGGNGGGANSSSSTSYLGGGGGGGASGQYVYQQSVALTNGQSVQCTVGSGNTSFGSYVTCQKGTDGGNGGIGNSTYGHGARGTGGIAVGNGASGGRGGTTDASDGYSDDATAGNASASVGGQSAVPGGGSGANYTYWDGSYQVTRRNEGGGGGSAPSIFKGELTSSAGGYGADVTNITNATSNGNNGQAGYGYGSGGGGGSGGYVRYNGSCSGGSGGAGAPGMIIIEW